MSAALLLVCSRSGSLEFFGATFYFWSRGGAELGLALSDPKAPQTG